tara:strand:+ start:257 stop:631 length:375 start_codon:yes stop_codon:yes gene_type:complete
MAYNYIDLEKQSLEAIEKHKLFFITDVVAYLPCSSSTFYDYKLEKSEAIKEALTKVKTELKVSMRSKWYKSQNATLQMGLMKLLSTSEEIKKLSMNTNVHEGGDKPIQTIIHLGNGIDPNGTTP